MKDGNDEGELKSENFYVKSFFFFLTVRGHDEKSMNSLYSRLCVRGKDERL